MAVPAIELRPRGAIALFDAAIRLCARSSGVWTLTLPGSAAVLWALIGMLERLERGGELLLPSLLLTVAWLFRAVCQGAACHYLDAQILAAEAPSAWSSFREALRRLPSLTITATYVIAFNLLLWSVSFGLAFFLLPALTVAYAATMKGQGHPLALYGMCARLLGAARSIAPGVRALFAVVVLVGLNLHIAANTLIYLGRKLVGLDLAYAQRFTSTDNFSWMVIVAALAFLLFEPLRAAVATLLVIDGRVRQEGLDLLATVEQLPRRRARNLPLGKRTAAGLIVAFSFFGAQGSAHAQAAAASAPDRVRHAAAACEYTHAGLQNLDRAGKLGPAEQAALRRLADEVEMYAFDWEDCTELTYRLDGALPVIAEVVDQAGGDTVAAAERARQILARPEFVPTAERSRAPAEEEAPVDDESGFWAKVREAVNKFLEWLFERDEDRSFERTPAAGASLGMGAANLVVIALVAAVVLVLVIVLIKSLSPNNVHRPELEVVEEAAPGEATGVQSALSRPPEGWASMADELAAQGNFREAIRHLYLALLSRLHRAGAIDYDPTLSNWDYCRRFRGHREWLPAFRDLTQRFDFAWYGQREPGIDGYRAFRNLSQPILAPDDTKAHVPGAAHA